LAQRAAGPFSHPPLPNFRVSPIGVVPNKAADEFRCIQHLAYPYRASINDGILLSTLELLTLVLMMLLG